MYDSPSFKGLPGGGKFTQFMSDHFRGNANRDVLLPVMNQEPHSVVGASVSSCSGLDRILVWRTVKSVNSQAYPMKFGRTVQARAEVRMGVLFLSALPMLGKEVK